MDKAKLFGATRRFRVAFFRHSLLNRGGDRIVIEYANDLAQKGHEVIVYANEIRTCFHIHSSVKIRRIPLKTKMGTLLYAILGKFEADLVIVDIIHLPFFLCLFNRVLYLAQAYDVMYYENTLTRKLISCLYSGFFRLGRFNTITVSGQLAALFRERYGAKRLTTVQNGIDLTRFYPEPDGRLIELKGNRKAILILSREDSYRKGGDLHKKVLSNLAKRHKADLWEAWVIGSPVEFLADGVCIRHFGSPTDEGLRRLLSSADIFLYPSRHEGFGLFPLEAMACGCLVVTTTAVPYARDRENALVAPVEDVEALTDRLSEGLADRGLGDRIRNESTRFVKGFDVERSKRSFEQALLDDALMFGPVSHRGGS